MANSPSHEQALNSARNKAYWRLIPLLFICYVIAYVDRANVAIAKFTMVKDLKGFDNAVIGFGAGIFFIGYFLLEIPGTLIVEKWSARKWICRIMVTWGIMAAMTAFVHWHIPGFTQLAEFLMSGVVAMCQPFADPNGGWFTGSLHGIVTQFQGTDGLPIFQFYMVRFLLGLAEAGFYPGVIVYLTHWFPVRDRARALAYFFIGTPVAQIISPKISNAILKIGTDEVVNGVTIHHPELLGLEGWQWVYIFWGIPAVILGVVVFFMLTDKPRQAKWLTEEERNALELELANEKAHRAAHGRHMSLIQGLSHPKVLLLAAAYFFNVTANYGFEFFLPSILDQWYSLKLNTITWLVLLPPCLALVGQLFVAWSSDRTKERRYHAVVPLAIGCVAMMLAPMTQGHLWLTIVCFMVAFAGLKAYLPAFWSLPNIFLAEAAAAGSIGLINSVGNLGGFVGPFVLGWIDTTTGSFVGGVYFLCAFMAISVTIIFFLGLGHKEPKPDPEKS